MSVRRLMPLLVALIIAVGISAAPPAAEPVRAATPDLTIVTEARYDVQPAKRRVRVTVDLVLRNRLKDTATRRFYFDRAFLAVLPGTSGFKLGPSGSVRATRKTKDYTLLQLNLGSRLFSGKTARYRLTFNLPDRGGSLSRNVRVGDSLASFPVWAFASDSTPGSSVSVVFPKGFTVQVESGKLPDPVVDPDGRTIFTTGTLEKPLSFFAYVVADRPGAYEEHERTAQVGLEAIDLTIRAWKDDPEWAKRVGGLFERGLPELSGQIGLPWSREGGLVVEEAASRSTGGYAGLFNPETGKVEVAYYADDFVVLHEAAHAWFNGTLLVDRWATEAFASYYALEAARALEVKAKGDKLTDALRESRIPLNSWGAIGREDTAVEDYAYAATLELARLIAERAGSEGLQAVWQAAADGVGAYQAPVEPTAESGTGTAVAVATERVPGPPDWRGLLDLLEDRTEVSYDDLWREWVIRPEDEPLLAARAAARERYGDVVDDAASWSLPRPIRDALRAWQFDAASGLLDEADAILDRRDDLETAAAEVGLTPPDTLQVAFEGDDGFADATLEADTQAETIERYANAIAGRPVDPGPLVQLGLWQADPEADLDAARTAFAAGDLEAAARSADLALATWLSAEQVGQGRALTIGLAVLVVIVLLVLVIVVVTRHRRGRRRAALARSALMAHQVGGSSPVVDRFAETQVVPVPRTTGLPDDPLPPDPRRTS
jgi:hypothetical protein